MLKQIRNKSEEQVTRLATYLISNEGFVTAVQAVVSRMLRTREQLEGGVKMVLGSLAVPTEDDMAMLQDRIVDLEIQVEQLVERMEAAEISLEDLQARSEEESAPAAPAPRKKATGAKAKGRR